MSDEWALTGGNMTDVVRVGDTIRRRAGPWTPTIQALLAHIRGSGFTEAPQPLGRDERDREVVSYIPGRAGLYPLAPFMWSDEVLDQVAKMLRRLHDATADFEPPRPQRWQLASHAPEEVICHNDIAPYNVVFEGDRPVAFIDFDTASPGPPVWDNAYAAYRFVPLTDASNPDGIRTGAAERGRRLKLFASSYGRGDSIEEILATVPRRLAELVAFIRTRAAAGDPAEREVLLRGDVTLYERDIAYVQERSSKLLEGCR